ncbi:DUF3179 domain-containing protein [Hoeflea poritis]|uniref:DUF3179 domain-containing protein n=1 Tax=Hoeflea poritis TaxID=2993659 RepID=A0ABT4VQB5_9HYPH|nr:DUF3179 domain-containing protein [Hoeflea poritis]MDA4846905.1 DUF3179 domain-containing protein [Hoeflea poritis]
MASAHSLIRLTALLLAGMLLLPGTAWSDPDRWEREGWSTDFSRHAIAYSEIMSGGPPKDGIPSIDNPSFTAVSEVEDLIDREPVMGLEINGDARAYPLRILMWHEIVNDTVGGLPVTVTYCPLCNAALVFDRRIGGAADTFGTTGKLRNSDLVMYDRRTESWWQQFTGEAIAGELTGMKLELIPSRLESWKNFKTRHPDGKVLVPNNPGMRDYGRNPYERYDTRDRPFLYRGELPEDIPAMARVVLVRDGGDPIAVTMLKVREEGPLERRGLTIAWEEGQASALDTGDIGDGREVGNITVQRDGKDVPYDITFAFVAHAFMPETKIEKAASE